MWEFIAKYWLEFVFGIVAAALTGAYAKLSKRVKETKAREQAIGDGVKYLLMFQLRELGEQYIADGKCSTEFKHEYEKVYIAYHALGGNGTITRLMEDVLRLPPG